MTADWLVTIKMTLSVEDSKEESQLGNTQIFLIWFNVTVSVMQALLSSLCLFLSQTNHMKDSKHYTLPAALVHCVHGMPHH